MLQEMPVIVELILNNESVFTILALAGKPPDNII